MGSFSTWRPSPPTRSRSFKKFCPSINPKPAQQLPLGPKTQTEPSFSQDNLPVLGKTWENLVSKTTCPKQVPKLQNRLGGFFRGPRRHLAGFPSHLGQPKTTGSWVSATLIFNNHCLSTYNRTNSSLKSVFKSHVSATTLFAQHTRVGFLGVFLGPQSRKILQGTAK